MNGCTTPANAHTLTGGILWLKIRVVPFHCSVLLLKRKFIMCFDEAIKNFRNRHGSKLICFCECGNKLSGCIKRLRIAWLPRRIIVSQGWGCFTDLLISATVLWSTVYLIYLSGHWHFYAGVSWMNYIKEVRSCQVRWTGRLGFFF
jgi:hypothetical protein